MKRVLTFVFSVIIAGITAMMIILIIDNPRNNEKGECTHPGSGPHSSTTPICSPAIPGISPGILQRPAVHTSGSNAIPLQAPPRPATGTPGPARESAQQRVVFGNNIPFEPSDLPVSPLRTELEALPEEIRTFALMRLARLSFHINDLTSLHVDASGMPYHVCTFTNCAPSATPAGTHHHPGQIHAEIPDEDPVPIASLAGAPAPYPGLLADVPISEPPIRHSKPGSPRVLFIDFNGHVVTNTAWNSSYSVARWDCRPFDSDGNTNTFSVDEQTYILQIWERVAEDYAPFDVDVTTEQPTNWTVNTAHALITQTNDVNGIACPHLGAGGIAYVDTFGQERCSYNDPACYSPAFVKPMSGYGYANTAEAAAHELGHNMGLNHDGTSTDSYYGGHGTGETSWGPIMGTGYGRNVSQWSKGEYHDANLTTEDDLAIIAGKAPYRADDHGNTNATASLLTTTNGTITTSGLISINTDVDVFSIAAGAGSISLTAFPYRCASGTYGGNLDIHARLYNSTGTLLTESNPTNSTRAYINYTAPAAGTYYLHIGNTGDGNPTNATPTGYTAYGSIGQYFITGRVVRAGRLMVQSPNGGNLYYKSQTNTICWSGGTNVFATARIDLYRNNTRYTTLTNTVTNSGTYAWTLTPPLLSDTNFRIRISSATDTSLWDESDAPFSIANPATRFLYENFDTSAALPAGWSRTNLTGSHTWQFQTGGMDGNDHPTSPYSPPYNACLYYDGYETNICRLLLPPLNLGNCTVAELRFQHYMEDWEGDQDTLDILVKTNGSAPWVLIASYTNSLASWTPQTLALPHPGTSYTIAFEGRANYGFGICLDEVEVYAYPEDINTVTNDTPLAWLADYGLDPSNTGALGDTDNDGLEAWQEWIAGTCPTQCVSVLVVSNLCPTSRILHWPAVTGRVYSVNWSSNLVAETFTVLASNITTGVYTDTVHTTDLTGFYRIGVNLIR